MARILLVENDREVQRFVKRCLEAEGLQVLVVADGESGLDAVVAERPELLILDSRLPRIDGLTVCRRLRSQPDGATLPVIMLSEHADDLQKVVGLEAGADDVLSWPCSSRELVARVRALMRRVAPRAQDRFLRVGGVTVDLSRYIVTLLGRELRLTVKEYELLRVLMEGQGRVLTRQELLQKVWRYSSEEEIVSRTIDVHIRRLREKLGPEGHRILTVRGVGYRFDVDRQTVRGAAGGELG